MVRNIMESYKIDSQSVSEKELINLILKDKRLLKYDIHPQELMRIIDEVQMDMNRNN